ncbi:MAG: NAD(+)/NADH kinase [Muribaculaceae bacterium]|nr:NAD(+)/NADH kinase [Muribaculaceae bacterium]
MRPITIAIYGKSRQDDDLPGILHLLAEARNRGFSLLCHEKFAAYLRKSGVDGGLIPPAFSGIPAADVAVSVGGDGTFLRTARRLAGSGIPIAGVNTGHLGYLAHFSLDDPAALLGGISDGSLHLNQRRMISVICDDLPDGFICEALNEIAVLKDDSASMINVHVELDGYYLADYRADGLIVSTATGSTAYNLSVGGPILQPELDCMVLAPVAPHSLTLRPIVISGSSSLRLTMESRTGSYRLGVDGYSCVLNDETTLELRAAPYSVWLLTPPDATFAASLREKLLWGRS